MFIIQWIHGLSLGIEYVEHETYGFIVNIDVGIVRVTWYRDIEELEEDE